MKSRRLVGVPSRARARARASQPHRHRMPTRTPLFALPLLALLAGCPIYGASNDDCASDFDCPAGAACRDGFCVVVGGASCRDDRDCLSGEICDRGFCRDAPPPLDMSVDMDLPVRDPACTNDAACGGGERCVEGNCRPESDVCQFEFECAGVPGGAVCLNGGGSPVCGSDADCGAGTTCDGGFCRPIAGECDARTACPGAEVCVGGRCLAECTVDGECGGLDFCDVDGLCRPDWRRQPFCTTNAQCAAGSQCVDGACRTPCPDGLDATCQMTDISLTVCSADLLCLTATEAAPECAAPTDCTGDRDCVNAICR